MTISSATSKNQYTANGSNTIFAYGFKVFDQDDIKVLLDDTVKTITTHYTVSGVGNSGGGNITFLSAPANNVIVTIKRNEPLTQEIDYVDGDDFPATAHEEGLDRSTIRDQYLQEQINRSILLPESTTLLSIVLPTPTANNILGWNSAADTLENKVIADTVGVVATAFIATLLDDASASTARATLGAAASGANSDITSLSAIASINTGAVAGFRNALINGNFDIWQRGISFAAPSNIYTADRWVASAGAITVSRAAAIAGDGATYKLKLTATSGTNSITLSQPLESSAVNLLKGKTVTFSFYAKGSAGNTFGFGIQKNATADTDSGGSWSTVSNSSFVSSASLTRYTVTASVPDDGTANGLRVYIDATNITNGAAVDFSQLQLEVGGVATPFEQRPIATEYTLCQRYYQLIGLGMTAAALGTTAIYAATTLPVIMRTSPTVGTPTSAVTINDTVGNFTQSAANATSAGVSTSGVLLQLSNFTGLTNLRPCFITTSAVIPLTAEL
jgi:hypothetical protein